MSALHPTFACSQAIFELVTWMYDLDDDLDRLSLVGMGLSHGRRMRLPLT